MNEQAHLAAVCLTEAGRQVLKDAFDHACLDDPRARLTEGGE
jgi:hypothetical protein